jgi:signal peptidase I
MAKSRSKSAKDIDAKKSDAKQKDDAKASKKGKYQQDGTRETMESIVVAFVLAFLFRAFEAEAFVIPTGSMAPTLFGRHKEADCKACGFHFSFGASDEIDDSTGLYNDNSRIRAAMCPNCRFENPVRDLPVFKGDRILVNKFPYEFADPQRWDVPVFKYPEKPTTNYIKRMVGLPGETIQIERGDVYRIEEDRTQSILRKKPSKQKVLQLPVYDNNHPETPLHEHGWPKRWAAVERATGAGAAAQADAGALDLAPVDGWVKTNATWQSDDEAHAFHLAATNTPGLKWLRYRHIIPSPDDWAAVTEDADGPSSPLFAESVLKRPAPQLITDFCGYNTYHGGNGRTDDDYFWCSDLTLSCTLQILSADPQSEVVFELNDGIRSFRCRIDVTTGTAKLVSVLRFSGDEGTEDVLAEADSGISGEGEWHIRFANVDDRLCLWVDDDLIDFGAAAEFPVDETLSPSPQNADLIPVGIAVQNAGVRVSDLLIERDLYYRASQLGNDQADRFGWHGDDEHPEPFNLRRALNDPAEWYDIYMKRGRNARFELGDDEYLMLGDNSPRSQDSRVWPNARGAERRHAVPRSALVGRAFYIYWPHGIPFMNGGEGFPVTRHKKRTRDGIVRSDYPDFRAPFYPNIWRMQRIR